MTTLVAAINLERIDPDYLADIVDRISSMKRSPASITSTVTTALPQKSLLKTREPILDKIDFKQIQLELMQSFKNEVQERRHCSLIDSLRVVLLI